jgi:hypothetical protein
VSNGSGFARGDRVRWSAEFLARGKLIDPRWHAEQVGARGTVDWVQRDGDVLVLWDGDATTCVHPPARLENLSQTIPFGDWGWVYMHLAESPSRAFDEGAW